jgi:hypothetical protein
VGGKLNIGAPDHVVRFQTGNIPSGVQIHPNGKVAYANNEVGLSVSILDLTSNTVLVRDVPSSTPPAPGSHRDSLLKGKLAFFTALGIPDDSLSGLGIRDIVDPVPRQAVERRLEHLRVLPSLRSLGPRDLVVRRRSAERDRHGRDLFQDQRRPRRPDQQLERGARQRDRLQQQLAERAVWQGLRRG